MAQEIIEQQSQTLGTGYTSKIGSFARIWNWLVMCRRGFERDISTYLEEPRNQSEGKACLLIELTVFNEMSSLLRSSISRLAARLSKKEIPGLGIVEERH